MPNYAEIAADLLHRLRERKPLVHNITNYVTMSFTANVLLAMGALPVMAQNENEAAETASSADALVLNLGTLSESRVHAMLRAGHAANKKGVPVVLDPVGVGALTSRNTAATRILHSVDVNILRANPTEIRSLEQERPVARGVDAVHTVDDVLTSAGSLSRRFGSVLAVSGPADLVTDGNRVLRIENGHPLMSRITGSGCAVSAVAGAFCAIEKDVVHAAAAALSFFGLAGETAALSADGPGSFTTALLDALYTLTPAHLERGARIVEDRRWS